MSLPQLRPPRGRPPPRRLRLATDMRIPEESAIPGPPPVPVPVPAPIPVPVPVSATPPHAEFAPEIMRSKATHEFSHMTEEKWLQASHEGRILALKRLGEGSSGSVQLCQLKGVPRVFALKEIAADPDPKVRKQVLRELQFNSTCDSPYIVKYYGAFLVEEVGSIFIAMEYCEGGSLDAILRRVTARGGRIGERVLAQIAESVLQGIGYLYDRQIIHRDIKPQNLLLTLNGDIKLCDFGVSGQVVNSLATTFTGTSYYMAPERIRGQPYTVTSDVWSLGVTLLEVAQARFPFNTGVSLTPIELLTQIVNSPTPELKDEGDIKWSASFRHFLKCCLEKDLKVRPSPKKLLTHPWITGMRSRPIDMARFVQECQR